MWQEVCAEKSFCVENKGNIKRQNQSPWQKLSQKLSQPYLVTFLWNPLKESTT